MSGEYQRIYDSQADGAWAEYYTQELTHNTAAVLLSSILAPYPNPFMVGIVAGPLEELEITGFAWTTDQTTGVVTVTPQFSVNTTRMLTVCTLRKA